MTEEILLTIWHRSLPSWGHVRPYLAVIDRRTNQFAERQVTHLDDVLSWVARGEMDMFFSPLLFDGPRTNATVALPGVLFADLDGVTPDAGMHPHPTVIWETSPGNHQAVWFLSEPAPDAVRWADVNQRLTYATHADKGGWHASKLLRIPGTRNYKYAEAPLGQVVYYEPTREVRFSDLERILPKLEVSADAGIGEYPEPLDHKSWLRYVKGCWGLFSMEQKAIIASPRQLDRSSAIVRLSNSLERTGLPAIARFHIIWGVAWNKWRTDRHNPAYLWQVVNS